MRTRISVALNGIELSSLDDSIVLQSVEPQTPSWNLSANSRGTRNGQRYVATEKRYRDVQVRFAIRERRDFAWRESVIQKVGNVTEWTNAYQITFRAFNIPCWINEEADTASKTGSSVSTTLAVKSNGGGKLRITAANSSGSTCNTATISANGYTIALTGLGLASGERLVIDYTDDDIQRIRIRNSGGTYRSALAKRTVASDDDIWLKARSNTITATSGTSLAWTFSCYGRWVG